jgi:hypothetical protein
MYDPATEMDLQRLDMQHAIVGYCSSTHDDELRANG